MAKILFKAFVALVLFSLRSTSGQKKIMVCKDIQNVFTDAENEQDGAHTAQLSGPPGKRGVPGVEGPSGLPGVQGVPGIPGVVDYARISEMIDEKIRQRSYCSVGARYEGKIPASSFSASSEHNSYHAARLGRVHTPAGGNIIGCWCTKTATIGDWIQVDLGRKTTVIGVMTQGCPKHRQWVTSYHISCSLTSSSVRKISDESGTAKIFIGNSDMNTVVTHFFRYQECRYLRIYPQTWFRDMCLRMDFIESC